MITEGGLYSSRKIFGPTFLRLFRASAGHTGVCQASVDAQLGALDQLEHTWQSLHFWASISALVGPSKRGQVPPSARLEL